MNWYIHALRNYINLTGRARRKEYWMFSLFHFIISFGLVIIDNLMGSTFLITIYTLLTFIPSITVGVRRLHDTDRSGWWLLISLIPLIGSIVLLVFMCLDSTPDNRFGPNPKNLLASKQPTENPFNQSKLVN